MDERGTMEVMTDERLAQLRREEGTAVLDFEDTAAFVLPMAAVSARIDEARAAFHRLRRQHPRWDDARIREAVRALSEDMREFSRTHMRIFAAVVSRDTPPETFEILTRGMAHQTRVERGEIEQEVALAGMTSDVLERSSARRGGGGAQRSK